MITTNTATRLAEGCYTLAYNGGNDLKGRRAIPIRAAYRTGAELLAGTRTIHDSRAPSEPGSGIAWQYRASNHRFSINLFVEFPRINKSVWTSFWH